MTQSSNVAFLTVHHARNMGCNAYSQHTAMLLQQVAQLSCHRLIANLMLAASCLMI